ncbi:MAG: hypothetical protein LBU66_06730 [Treponema sp.]|nr:hypothetical protein [Treponema sp.]
MPGTIQTREVSAGNEEGSHYQRKLRLGCTKMARMATGAGFGLAKQFLSAHKSR